MGTASRLTEAAPAQEKGSAATHNWWRLPNHLNGKRLIDDALGIPLKAVRRRSPCRAKLIGLDLDCVIVRLLARRRQFQTPP